MIPLCTKSKDGRHNFPPNGNCINGCGLNQLELSGGKARPSIENVFSRVMRPRKAPKGIHSELHEFIDETRKEWNDKLPFGRWLGALKGVPLHNLYMIRGSIRDSRAKSPAKLFFWKIKELKKPKQDVSRGTELSPAIPLTPEA